MFPILIFVALLLSDFEANEPFEVRAKVIWNFNSAHSFDLINKLSVIVITNLEDINMILIELQNNIIGRANENLRSWLVVMIELLLEDHSALLDSYLSPDILLLNLDALILACQLALHIITIL